MRVTVVHSFYRSEFPSGENAVVEAQVAALRRAGHQVQVVAKHSDHLDTASVPRAAILAWQVAVHGGKDPERTIRRFRPEVVHVHNLFPNFGYSWLRNWPGPLVATLHNYRPVCAQGSFFRSGRTCMDCMGEGGSLNALAHGCYRQSTLATVPMVIRNRRGVLGDPLLTRAERLAVLSPTAFRIYVSLGVPAERLRLIPNGLPDEGVTVGVKKRTEWLLVGRLSPEKGVLEAIASWPSAAASLVVVGDGPLRQRVEELSITKPNVSVVGPLGREAVAAALARARGVLVPSLCPENLPTVMIEALRAGTPLLARRGNSVADFIQAASPDGVPGRSYGSTVELEAVLSGTDFDALRPAARRTYEVCFREEVWISALESLYAEAQESRHRADVSRATVWQRGQWTGPH